MSPQRRAVVTRWLLPLLAVAILVAVVALAGGLRTTDGVAGRSAEPGEPIDLARWQVTVHEVELVNTTMSESPTDNTLRVHLTVTLTGDASEFTLPTELVTVIPEGGSAVAGYQVDAQWRADLDPHVARSYIIDCTWPELDEDGEQPPLAAPPITATVVVRDEIWTEGPLFGWDWEVDDVAAVVPVTVTDNRVAS